MKKYHSQGIKLSKSGVSELLRNEKYQGNMLLQKTFVTDHLTKSVVKNVGQLPQYFVEDSHEAIIDRNTFTSVQAEIARRAEKFKNVAIPQESYPYTGLIICGRCGAPYKRKHAAAGCKYEKIVWICTTFNSLGKDQCDAQQIPENILDDKVAEVGGLELISEIRVPRKNTLTFIMKNGHVIDIDWQHISRRHSWTPEMKEEARQRQLAIAQKRREQNE